MFIYPEMGRQLARSRSEEAQARTRAAAATRESALERRHDPATADLGMREIALPSSRRRWLARRPGLQPNAPGPTDS